MYTFLLGIYPEKEGDLLGPRVVVHSPLADAAKLCFQSHCASWNPANRTGEVLLPPTLTDP